MTEQNRSTNNINTLKSSEMKIPVLYAPVTDPLHNVISTERYLESLERKLERIKGNSKGDVTSRQIISSLEKSKDDHMRNFLMREHVAGSSGDDLDKYKGSVLNKNHSNMNHDLEEVVALIFQDELSKTSTNPEENKT